MGKLSKFKGGEMFDLLFDGYQTFTLFEDGSLKIDGPEERDEDQMLLNFPSVKDAEKWLAAHFDESNTVSVSKESH